ncbi:ATP-binding protein [Pseudooceanicola nanhaiensis]|uniref:hybrid sensor histidine kinase/response regulator n=1 Tax=Pseudooceanicola nanhaiensis TaxID=375761 RepID=UPI001CD78396|nr:ATP-binding protein [Pseudooceanicola nanhaiensis]MCA0920728.1 response regulator [Pseudooceanicola nanhaiensis]
MSEMSGGAVARLSAALMPRRRLIVILGIAMLVTGLVMRQQLLAIALMGAGLTLTFFALLVTLVCQFHRRETEGADEAIMGFVRDDIAPAAIADSEGVILARNSACDGLASPEKALTVAGLMAESFSNPSAVLFRLQARAARSGTAREDIVTRRGQARLSAHRLPRGRFLWRIEEFGTLAPGAGAQELPLLTIGRSNAILHMNDAARALIGHRPKALDAIFPVLPVVPGATQEVSAASGALQRLVVETGDSLGRRELLLLPPPGDTEDRPVPGWDYFDELPVPLLRLGADGRIQMANRFAQALLGPDCRVDAALSDVVEGLGRSISDWLSEAAAGRPPPHSEFLRLKAPDREAYVQVTLKRVVEEGAPALIAVLSDATELKTLEAQFVQSQKMQAIGQLAGGVAHDFNNLLTAISGHCDLLLLRHDPGDPDYGDLVQINQNANRAAALVGQLLAFSRKQTLRPEELDLRDTLSELTHLLNRLVGERITLSLSHDPVLRPIRADKRQLEQVLMNLVVNARDAMPDGGEIQIVTETLRLREPLIRDRATVTPGEYVSVKVIDTGQGIPADKVGKVFEPFYTTKRVGEGTGLGLSTAYGIVKQTGGFIFAESTPGEGSCFTLLFPVYTAPAMPAASEKEGDTAGPGPRAYGVVLLVEDEAPVRAFASRALRLRGYTVLEAESAEDALRTLEDHQLQVDLFVTDVVMPGMDGPSWVREARKNRPDVRVVFVSGYAEENFSAGDGKIPNSVFLPKPFSLAELTETVQRQLH